MKFEFVGSNIKAQYTEPTQNELNDNNELTPLTDLGKTSVKYQVAGTPDTFVAKEVPATSPNGGGAIDETFSIPALSPKQATVEVWATATDLLGNESAPSVKTTLSVDKLAPLPPA